MKMIEPQGGILLVKDLKDVRRLPMGLRHMLIIEKARLDVAVRRHQNDSAPRRRINVKRDA